MLNGLKVEFINECLVKNCDVKAIAIVPCKGSMYEMHFSKVDKADAANLVQSLT